jgi:hypothetical protein
MYTLSYLSLVVAALLFSVGDAKRKRDDAYPFMIGAGIYDITGPAAESMCLSICLVLTRSRHDGLRLVRPGHGRHPLQAPGEGVRHSGQADWPQGRMSVSKSFSIIFFSDLILFDLDFMLFYLFAISHTSCSRSRRQHGHLLCDDDDEEERRGGTAGDVPRYNRESVCFRFVFASGWMVSHIVGVYSHQNVLMTATHTHSTPGGYSW